MASLLIHSDDVPASAREALRSAMHAAPEKRESAVVAAAMELFHSTDLECSEVRDLVGLPQGVCG